MFEAPAAARSELTPTGKLRVGVNMSNFLLTRTDAATGKPAGLAVDLAHELGRRLDVAVEVTPYPNPGALADAAKSGVWDVGFLGAEPQRANEIDFTAAYVGTRRQNDREQQCPRPDGRSEGVTNAAVRRGRTLRRADGRRQRVGCVGCVSQASAKRAA